MSRRGSRVGTRTRGVRFFGEGNRTCSLVMTMTSAKVRFIDTVHLERRRDVKVRFQ